MLSLLPRWPKRIVGPVPTLKELNVLCWGLFLAGLVLPLFVALQSQRQSGQTLANALNADFVYFYGAGRILNEYPPEKLYDYELEKRIWTEIHVLKIGAYGPFPYPPFVAILFRPLALLPYSTAYLAWVFITLILYIGGLAIISSRFFPHDPLRQSLIFCFALAFYPFAIETMLNGQVSAIGFFALALVLREEAAGRPLLSGLALSACLYKPTLMVLFLPMLFVTRRFRAALGFALGAAALLLFTTVVEGTRVWSGYLDLLLNFGKAAAEMTPGSFRWLLKYVDLNAFSALIPGGRSWVGLGIIFGYTCWAALSLVRVWWKSAGLGKPVNTLVWATTITWTLLLNVYSPIYESIFVVLGIVVTSAYLKNFPQGRLQRWFTPLWFLVFVCSWITRDLAQARFQVLTVSLAGFGMLQLAVLNRVLLPQPQHEG
jgi:hypothetical protein